MASAMWLELPGEFSSAVDKEPNSVLLRTARFDSFNHTSYLFRECREVLAAHSPGDLPRVFAGIEAALGDGSWVAGFLGYECGAHFEPRAGGGGASEAGGDGVPLAWFGVYERPVVFEHDPARRREALVEAQISLLRASRSGRVGTPCSDRDDGFALAAGELGMALSDYSARVARIKGYIEAGDTYQVNLTTSVRMAYSGGASALFSRLLRNQPVAYGALLNLGDTQIVSASPELFFRLSDGEITTRPMKGTAARGKDTREDAAVAAWLAQDEKNRSENVMIVDLLRSDLGRICEMGGVRVEELFGVERYRTLFQMTSTVSGRVRAEAGFYEIFRALFPSGSIVGAPKVRTMQIVGELEGRRRGVYTGAIGFISPRRGAVFSVAIRTLVLRDGAAEMGVGSGIVYDSDAEAEYEECRLKAAFLHRDATEFELIETMLWDAEYFLLAEHMERLGDSADYFDFAFNLDEVLAQLRRLAAGFAAGSRHRVRLLLDASGAVRLSSAPLEHEQLALRVKIASERVSRGDLYLRHKTTCRTVYDRVYREAVAAGLDDAIFLNERDEIAEGAIHNVFVVKEGRWLTPPLSAGVLPGVYRRHLLETRREASEQTLTVDDLREADRVVLCNSVRGLREVGSILFGREEKSYSSRRIQRTQGSSERESNTGTALPPI